MDGITIGQVAVAITFLVGIISGVTVLLTQIKKGVRKAMEEPIDEIKKEIQSLDKSLKEVDMESCKNFLVSFLAEVEKGEHIDEIEMERFFEQYSHYTKNGGNSYIKRKVEKLQDAGRL